MNLIVGIHEQWVNGVKVAQHSGGYLPFKSDISSHLKYGLKNSITVAVNNTLTPWTIPQGRFCSINLDNHLFHNYLQLLIGKIVYHNDTVRYPSGYYEQLYNFDFFNYAGIHRPVVLYTSPRTFIEDVSVTTVSVDCSNATLNYSVNVEGPQADKHSVQVKVYDAKNLLVALSKGSAGQIKVPNVNLWWPRGMNQSIGYLYTIKVLSNI